MSQAASYSIQVATSPSFANVVASASGLTTTSFTPAGAFNTSSTYYWRVWAENACGTGAYSAVYSFSTVAAPGDCGPGLQPSIVLTESFEGGANGWTLGSGSTGNTWALWYTNVHSGSYAYHSAGPVPSATNACIAADRPTNRSITGDSEILESPGIRSRTGGCVRWRHSGGHHERRNDMDPNALGLLTDPYNGPIASGNLSLTSTVGVATRRTGSIASSISPPMPDRPSNSVSAWA